MVNALVDTSILVDVIRQRSFATQWLWSQTDLDVTPIVRMELVAGAKDKPDQIKATQLVSKFQMVYFTQSDLDWAMEQQEKYALSHNVGMNDCLIASVAHRLQLPLHTTNIKHFVPLLGALINKPY